ncbi:MAG TPA: N-methyl-L-tryptophan oxidase [Ktedonobacterales bacterium]|nr:N-methyl-L-tryptophan oxidase [Ktedonobacterales bacterium]
MANTTAVVVGGGVMGMATACALAGRGVDVTVLERFTLGHEWASSHGLTRAIRHAYGSKAIYTQMVTRSLALWADLARETGRQLYTETGVLTLGRADDGETLPGYEVMRAEGIHVERWAASEARAHFPQFAFADDDVIVYTPQGGMMHASECLLALADRLRARGGVLREGVQVTRAEPIGPQGEQGRVTLADGSTLTADRVIVTAGPWVHDALPDLRLPVRATRQQVAYFSGLPAEQFGVGVFPVFLAGLSYEGYYGFPLQGPGWFKAASHIIGQTSDPNDPYPPDEAEVANVRAFLRRVIPAAAEAPLALVDRCRYDMTPDEDFILDNHPGGPGVVIGSGFSGHGFKFGVLIGELLAALALGEVPAFPLDRFRLERFSVS